MKILYVLPHCSTGGMPQYVLRLVQEMMSDHKIEVVEVSNLSNEYTVQRDKISKIVKLHQLDGDQEKLIKLLPKFDIIHFQEIPENFLSDQVLDQIYHESRTWKIVVTTHSSYTDPTQLRFLADRFVLVSKWSLGVFKAEFPDICDIWEYPIDQIEYDKDAAKSHLDWDPSYHHVLHVGLFTPGKNQRELVEIARLCETERIKFHFVGNTAPNFAEYWQPIFDTLPQNCIVHGEVSNTEDYYKAADLFYFPSTFELNPLAVKEAISHGLPILIKNLHTYAGMYDLDVPYLSDSIESNRELLLKMLNINLAN